MCGTGWDGMGGGGELHPPETSTDSGPFRGRTQGFADLRLCPLTYHQGKAGDHRTIIQTGTLMTANEPHKPGQSWMIDHLSDQEINQIGEASYYVFLSLT